MNNGRLITGGRSLLRLLCTVATVTEKPKLYKRLSKEIQKTGSSRVSQTLNQYILEGKAVGKEDLDKCVLELRKNRNFLHALEIMEWMQMRKLKFSSDNYAVYLDLVSKAKGVVEAEDYFDSLPPVAKNKFTYGSLLNCYCKELMSDKALAHFNKMDELGYVTSFEFTNLMSMYMRLGQPLRVNQLVKEMKRRNCMTVVTYTVWMNSYAASNDLDGVEKVYEEMIKEDQYKTNWTTYRNLATVFVKADQFEKAELMLRKLEEVIQPQEREPYHFLLTIYAGIGNLNEVYRVWESLKAVSPVTNQSYFIILSTLQRLNDMKGIIKCFEEWKSSSIRFDKRLIRFAVPAYLSQGMDEEAALVFVEAIGRCGKGSFSGVRENFMMHFLEKGQLDGALSHLEAVLSKVTENKWRPPRKVVSAFLKYYKEKTDLDGVDELCKIFKTHNLDGSWLKTCIPASG